ncbi:mannitol operon transcriptional antiterminator [Pullulanibacillus pueri]|uniref:Transcriptional regulator MtlR n=2 Tax=Pullulanibacillus pueri TaxID=1437324 RepID=A0A8J2ZXS4_9BACL|nr:BglG family transcription antiterminator [Pullulanibacillus pueri]MBM7682929.1 mannitol operon transcriptional antiterminator [Pullulanibacillus pueri]GGH84758.1 transcriptional regulator MtlR [Pullulanibacillus pueri]
MYITARERVILEILLSVDADITIKSLAEQINISERTVHRDLKGIEEILKAHHLSLIKKAGVGIRINGKSSDIEALKLTLYRQTHNDYTPEERQTIILCHLLEAVEPMKIIALANELNVTIVTISNDLNKLDQRLKAYHLTLIKKRGYGIELKGTEDAKRKAMSDIIAQNLDEGEFLSLVRKNIQNKESHYTDTLSEKLLGLVEKEKLIIVEKIVDEINSELDYFIADSAFIGLVVHLSLAIERILQGENIVMDPATLESLKLTSEYKIAHKMIERIETVFDIEIPEAEIGYITMHLQGAKLRYENEYAFESPYMEIANKAKQLIEHVGQALDVDLTSHYSLFQGLVVHLTPALHRIKQRMRIHNPLYERIKKDYAELFAVIKKKAGIVFPELSIPDEEIAFLVLHFGSALMNHKQMGNFSALVICSTGIGTSKILSTRLTQEIPEIKAIKNVSLFELEDINTSDFDLVLSTIRLPNLSDHYILVSPMLTENEIKQIKDFIKGKSNIYSETWPKPLPPFQKKRVSAVVEGLTKINHYTQSILAILQGFKVKTVKEASTIEAALLEVCEGLVDDGSIEDVEKVVTSLLMREKLGGLGIPNTRLALFHSRSSDVKQPVFTINVLPTPLKIKAMDDSWLDVDQLLLLLAPELAPPQEMEVLSFISSLIIENNTSMTLFASQEKEPILSYMATKFEQFFLEKIAETRNA